MSDDSALTNEPVKPRPGAATALGALDVLLGGIALLWGLFRIAKAFNPEVGGVLYGVLNIPAFLAGALGLIAGVGLLGEKKWGVGASAIYAVASVVLNIPMLVAALSTEQGLGQIVARHAVVGIGYPVIALLLGVVPTVREFYRTKGE